MMLIPPARGGIADIRLRRTWNGKLVVQVCEHAIDFNVHHLKFNFPWRDANGNDLDEVRAILDRLFGSTEKPPPQKP